MLWLSKLFGGRTRKVASSSLHGLQLDACALMFAEHARALTGSDLELCVVENTNSMIPTLDNNCVLLAEKCEFADLAEGDIVLWRGSARAFGRDVLVCHRINERAKSGWFTLGDGNSRQDPEPMTPANFHRRVVAICYGARKPDTDN